VNFRRLSAIVLFNLILLAGLFELVGIAYDAATEGGLFYVRPPTANGTDPRTNPFAGADYRPLLHLYLGFVFTDRAGASTSRTTSSFRGTAKLGAIRDAAISPFAGRHPTTSLPASSAVR